MTGLLRKTSLFVRTLVLILFYLVIQYDPGYSQTIFSPEPKDEQFLKSLASKYEKQYKERVAALPSSNKKDFEEVYTLRWKLIKEIFEEQEVYTSTASRQYLDGLVQEIVKANPFLSSQSFTCFFSRSGTPNASYLGEGIILFNMGLFTRLENESQAAFVICHEIAHFYLQHSDKSIRKYVASINSAEVQKELRRIKNSEYGKREQFEKLAKNFAFNTRRHGRENENEADSMAVELMRASRFDPSQAITTLSLLDNIDTDTLNIATTLQKIFHAREYPFQKRWIKVESGLLGGHATLEKDNEMTDSLKTHPDCKTRMKAMDTLLSRFKETSISKQTGTTNSLFRELQKLFSYEVVEFAYTSDNYTRSLFYTLEMLEQHPADPYLVAQVGKIFNGLYDSQKNHTLGKVIELPSPYHNANYNLLLQFIQNLYREEYASISYHYLKQYHPVLDHYTPFKNVYNSSIQIAQR